MSKILELQQKAQNLQEQHQKNIDEKLEVAMNQIFSDTQHTLNAKAQSLSESIDSTKQNIQIQQSTATAQIIEQIKTETKKIAGKQQQEFKQLLQSQQQQMDQLKVSLNELNHLSEQTARQMKLKKVLFTSNIVLISTALITLISSICFGYVSNSKYNDINEMQKTVDYLKQQGGSMITTSCEGKLCVELDPKYLQTKYALDGGTRPLGIVREVR